jgi:hypothetical protein
MLSGMNAISAASMGMLAAARRFDAAATRVAAVGSDPTVVLEVEAVEMIQSKTAFRASAQAVKVADQMYGSLLDIFA